MRITKTILLIIALIIKTVIYFVINTIMIFLIIGKFSLTDPEDFFFRLKKVLIK